MSEEEQTLHLIEARQLHIAYYSMNGNMYDSNLNATFDEVIQLPRSGTHSDRD